MVENKHTRRRFLTESRLPFVRPEDEDSDPDRIWERLSAPTDQDALPGVLLTGAAGTGKTRTCFEVAALAEQARWQVFHVATDVSTQDLVQALDALTEQRVLLVLDYLEKYTQLDLRAVGSALDDRAVNAKVACLATVRPGALQVVRSRGSGRLLEERVLGRDEEHQKRVVQAILRHAADRARRLHEESELTAACGSRPGLALLIARVYESDPAGTPAFRRDQQLSDWLPRRLMEDVTPPSGGTVADDTGAVSRDTWLLASVVAAASCPQDRHSVAGVVARFLSLPGDRAVRDPAATAQEVVSRLVALDWLVEADSAELDVMHDLVADELLSLALIPDGLTIRENVAGDIFSALLADARTLRLATDHLNRWTADLSANQLREIRRVCGAWFAKQRHDVGELLSEGGSPAEGTRTLLSVLSGPTWQSGVVAAWDDTIEPGLRRIAAESPGHVRYLFAHAIRNTSDAMPRQLAAAAVRWLEEQTGARDVHPVVEALLRASGAPYEVRAAAVRHADGWLATHGTTAYGARNLVSALLPLLTGDDGLAQAAKDAVDRAVGRIPPKRSSPEADHVLRRLLQGTDPHTALAQRVVRSALARLKARPSSDQATFLLRPLLKRTDLTPTQTTEVLDAALTWLDSRPPGTSADASFALSSLLGHPGISHKRADAAVDRAWDWLAENDDSAHACYVLARLLARDDQHPDRMSRTIDKAVEWLNTHHSAANASLVFRSIIGHPVLPAERVPDVARLAGHWLTKNGLTRGACSVLPLMLGLPKADSKAFLAATLDWLAVHSLSPKASFVLAALLKHPGLDDAQAEAAARYALAWIKEYEVGREFVLKPLLSLPALGTLPAGPDGMSLMDKAVDAALAWLTAHDPDEPDARFLLEPLLRRRDLDPATSAKAVDHALAWLTHRDDSANARFVLQPLLHRADLDAVTQQKAVDHALAWLARHDGSPQAFRVLRPLIDEPPPDEDRQRRIGAHVLNWLATDDRVLDSTNRLHQLCKLAPLSAAHETRIAELVLDRLGAQCSTNVAAKLLPAVLHRGGMAPEQWDALVDSALWWLGTERFRNRGGPVLRLLLGRSDLDPERTGRAMERARTWLDSKGETGFAGVILRMLLDRPDLGILRVEIVGKANAWLAVHHAHPLAEEVRSALRQAGDDGQHRPPGGPRSRGWSRLAWWRSRPPATR